MIARLITTTKTVILFRYLSIVDSLIYLLLIYFQYIIEKTGVSRQRIPEQRVEKAVGLVYNKGHILCQILSEKRICRMNIFTLKI